MKNFKGYIWPVQKFSILNISNSDYFARDRRYIFNNLGSIPKMSLIV